MRKNQTNNGPCEIAFSVLTICGNHTEGQIAGPDSLITSCAYGFNYDIDLNALDINSTIHYYQFNGTALTVCWNIGEASFNITGNMYLNNNTIDGTESVCDNTHACNTMSFSGTYESLPDEQCYDAEFEGIVCRQ